MTIRKITNLTSGLVTLADLRTPTTFVHKATVTRPTITASNVTQAAIVKSTLSTRQLVAAARFINRLIFREADAFALLDLIGITVGKSAADSIGLIDIVALRSARGPQRAFDDVELINDFIAFVLHVNRSFADAVEVQQYVNLIVAKSAGNDVVQPADSRYFDLTLKKADAVIGRDTQALLVNKPFIDSASFADALKITSRKLLNDSTVIDSYFALRAGKGIFDNIGIASLTQKDFGKLSTDTVAIDQTQAIVITKAAADSITPVDANALTPVLSKTDRLTVTENRSSFFISKGLGDNQPMTDLFGVFDGVVYTLSFQLFDAMAVTDAFARSFNVRRSLADVLLSSDTVIPQLRKLYLEITDVSDVRILLFGKAAFDSIVESDITAKFIVAGRSDRIEETDVRNFLITNLRQDTVGNADVTVRQFGKQLVDINTAADLIAKLVGRATANSVDSSDQRALNFNAGRADIANATERRFLTVGKPLAELISSTLPTVPAAPEIPSLSSYSTVLRSTLAVNSLNKVEIGTANIYNTTNISGGRLLFTGYPGTRYIDFAPVSSYQADGANWSYGLDVEFYGGDGSNELETPDVGEDLVLMYSTNGGASFTTAQTLWAGADDWAATVGANSSLAVNVTVSSSASTGFIWRIAQFNYSNPGFDQYAVARATATNWGAAATTIQLTDLVAIYDYARAIPQDRQVYIYDSVFVLNLRPRSAADDIVISDVKTFNSTLQKFDAFNAEDLLTLVFDSSRTFDVVDNLVFISDVAGLLSGISFGFDNVTTSDFNILLRGLPREDSFTIDDRFADVVRAFRVFPEGTQPIDLPQKNYIKPVKQGQGVTKTVVGWGLTISQPPDTRGDFLVIGDPTTFATTTALPSRRSGTSLENISIQYEKTADNLTPARVTVGGTSGFRSFNSTSTETVKFTIGKLLPRVTANEAALGSIIISGFISGLTSLSNSDNHAMSADFTIETYVYVSAANPAEITVAAIGNPSSPNYYRFGISSTGRPFYSKFGLAAPEFFGGTILTDRWYHLAFTRLGDVMTCWLNGYNQGSFFAFGDVGNTQGIKILETSGIAYVSQFRIIHGLALYQDNFAPPRGELLNLSGTTVLLPTYDAASFITNYNATYPLTASGTLTFSRLAPYRIDDGTTELLFVGRNDIRRTSGSNLENTAFNFTMPARAGSAYTIFTETQDGALDTFSSLSVLINARDNDRVGIIDTVNANFYVDRGAADTLIIGSRIPFRTPSALERISFLVTKYIGDTTTMLDLANVFDGLVYVDTKLIRDTLVIGLPNTTRVSDSDQERVSFDYRKSAKQGAVLKVVSGWGANVVGTTSSGDFIVMGDPSVFTATLGVPSRRSGTSLENFSFQYVKPADGLIGTSVTVGSSIGDRLQGANRENVRFTAVQNKFENVQPYDLNSIFKNVTFVAKAGSAYSITRKTIDGLFENQSSVAVGIGAQQPDQTGVVDFYLAEWYTNRTTSDSVILGSRIPFRTPSNLERISFLVTKFFGDDGVVPDDFLQTFDGLTYAAFLLERDTQTIGSGALAANNRFLGSEENTAFDVRKSARQGAILKVVQGWGSSVTGTTSSGDFIVIGDPTALPTTNTAPSRRSGASLENFSFQYFKPADNLVPAFVIPGSSIGDRLQGANRENVSFIFRKLANTEYGPDTVQPYDLNSIFKQFNLTAKAGSAYAITRKTINGLPDFQSSVAVGIGAQQLDQTGVVDAYLAEFATSRTTSDAVTIGYSIPFRTPNTLERISFLVTKFLGDDGVVPNDFLQTFDGLTYAAFLLERDIQIMGSGALAANNRFLGSPEVVNFDVVKSARQGAILKQITGWGSSVTGTTSSGDFVVIGDPTALPTTNAAPSRRSGASLENISLQYFKPADGLIGTSVTVGSSLGDRLLGSNRENVSFRVTKAVPRSDLTSANSILFDGNSFLSNSGDFSQASLFTMETWIYVEAFNSSQIQLLCLGDESTGRVTFGISPNGEVNYNIFGEATTSYNTSISVGGWTHIAFTRNSLAAQAFVNGTSQGVRVVSTGTVGNANGIRIGSDGAKFYLSQYRFTPLVRLYATDFTPSTTPVEAVAGSSGRNAAIVLPAYDASNYLASFGTVKDLTTSGTLSFSSFGPFAVFDGRNDVVSIGLPYTGTRWSGDSRENTAFRYTMDAKAGSAYSITRKTFDGTAGAQSSVTVGIGSKQQDALGFFDYPELAYASNRVPLDSVTIGYSIPFRTPNTIERISFLITKFFGDDGVIPDDFLQTFDGLTYADVKLLRDTQIMGSGATAANNRFLGIGENTAFDVTKSARQGAAFKQITGWNSSVTGTTSSGDFIVIGDPSAVAPTAGVQSRRSGASLERFSFDYSKPFATTAPYGTNLLQYSEQIGTLFGTGALQDQLAAIAAAGASFDSNYFVAPDRTVTGDRINTTSNTGTVKYDIIVSSSTTYTWSFWALKTVASGNTNLSVRDYTNSNDIIAPTDYQPNLSLSSWTRIVRTFTTPANAQSIGLNFITGSSNSIGLWGWSLEPGSSVGPYVQTTAAAIVASGGSTSIEYNNVGVDDVFRRVIPFRRLFQDGQEAFERSFKDVSLPRAGVDSFGLTEAIIVTKLLDYRFFEALGDRDPYGTVALVDRGFVRMTNYVEDIDYFAEDYTGVQRNLSNFYYPPLKVDVEDFITVSDDVSFVTGQWVQRFFGPFDPLGDLDPFGNINTLINRGTLRITNYVEDIDYFESDYIGESRTIS